MPLWDRYGRPLLNVRLAVTLRCNFRCFFCHSEGLKPRHRQEMEPRDYLVLALAARKVGVRSFKLTGGEPLVRRDIVEVVEALREGHPTAEISMTTNGYFLDVYAAQLAEHKLHHVNVSLHTLNPLRFREITGVDGLERVLRGIRAARDAGLRVKINTVALRGLTREELERLIDFAAEVDASIHIIELHPVGISRELFEKYYIPHVEIVEMLRDRVVSVDHRLDLHNRLVLKLDNGVVVEVVGPTGNPVFCAGCTRIRVTPYGEMTPCLNRGDILVPFLDEVHRAATLEEAVEAVVKAFRRVNELREPYYLYRLDTPPPPKRPGFRIYLPKRDGVAQGVDEGLLLRSWKSRG